MKLASGHEVIPLEGEELEHQMKDWKGYKNGLVRLSPGRWLLPTDYTRYADGIYNFKFRSSDVVIMTYPKCGTNWTQEIIWTMRNNPEFNHPLANVHMIGRSPFMDFDMLMPVQTQDTPYPFPFIEDAFNKYCSGRNREEGVHLLLSENTPDPRTIKSHLPFTLMPPSMLDTCKVVYVARNPKDVIVSYHHHSKIIDCHGYVGNLEDFVQYFVDDDLVYGPYWLHLKEAWEKKTHPNLHIVFYEDLKANPLKELKKLDTFLDTKLTEKQLEDIVKYTSFGEMKARFGSLNPRKEDQETPKKEVKPLEESDAEEGKGFFRKGQVGDWKNKMSPAMEGKVNQWIQKNMTNFGLDFRYEL